MITISVENENHECWEFYESDTLHTKFRNGDNITFENENFEEIWEDRKYLATDHNNLYQRDEDFETYFADFTEEDFESMSPIHY